MNNKHATIILSFIFAIVWLLISIFNCFTVSFYSYFRLLQVGLYMILSIVGVVLHLIGAGVAKKGVYLSGLILESVAMVICFSWGFGFILSVILGFIGFYKWDYRTNKVTPNT